MAIKPPSTIPTPSSTPQPLTFPAQTFAKLSPSAYLSAHLTSPNGPLRPSGRRPSECRAPTVHTGSLTHTHGSAVVCCGDTAVVCGIRGEILRVEDIPDWDSLKAAHVFTASENEGEGEEDVSGQNKQRARRKREAAQLARLNLLVPNLDLQTGCSPSHLPGGPPSTLAQTLTQRILTLLHTSHILNLRDLEIWSSPSPQPSSPPSNPQEQQEQLDNLAQPQLKAFYALHISILPLSLSGPAFDTAWLALLAALRSVRLPRAYYDAEQDVILCSPLREEARGLEIYDMPVALSFGVFCPGKDGVGKGGEGRGRKDEGKYILADPDGFEEALCKEMVTVVVGSGGRVFRIEKGGGTGVGVGGIRGLVERARERREEWIGVLEGR